MSGARRYGVAVIGGGIGRLHIEAWRALPGRFAVEAVCDLDRARAAKLAAEFAIPLVLENLDAALARDEIDIVDICTPSATHAALAEEALAAGKHVVLEKPFAGSLAEADRLIDAASRARGTLMPIFQYRWGNGVLKLRHLQAKGLAGRLHFSTVETSWRRGPDYYAVPWRGKWASELGGCLTTHAIHAHDLLCWIAGPPRSVFARTATRINPIEVEDCAAASLEIADGSLATLSVTLGAAAEISRLRFCFDGFTAESSIAPYTPGADPWRFAAPDAAVERAIAEALADFAPQPERFAGQFAAYHDALERRGPMPVTLAEARGSIELLTALYHSAGGGFSVALPIPRAHPAYAGWRPA